MQTEYMAREKGKDWYVLFAHCVCYCVPFSLMFSIDFRILILFITHFIADALKARYHKTDLLVDQIIHYIVTLIFLF